MLIIIPWFCKTPQNTCRKHTGWSLVKPRPAGLKVAFPQKGLMRLSFLQTGKPDYFPELKFWIFFLQNGSNHFIKGTLSYSNAFFEHSEQLHVLIWHDLSHLEGKKFKILAQENNQVCLFEEMTKASALADKKPPLKIACGTYSRDLSQDEELFEI